MAVTLFHSFESGQPGGTTITGTSGGNSAVGGNFFDSVTSGTGTTATYDSTAYRGALSGAFSSGGTSAASSVNWTTSIGTAVGRCYGRTVINGSSFTTLIDFLRCRGLAAQAFRVRINASGKLEFRNSANALLATSTTTFATVTWYLIRWDITVGASATGVIYIHTDPTTGTAAEVLTANAANFGTNNIDEVNYGAPVAAIANAALFRHDDILFTDQGLPGPPTQTVTLTDAFTTSDSLARTVALPRAVTDAVTTADTVGRTLSLPRSLTDGFTTADVAGRTLLLPRAVADSISTADTVTRTVALTRTAADAIHFGDTVTATPVGQVRDLVVRIGEPFNRWQIGPAADPQVTFGEPANKWQVEALMLTRSVLTTEYVRTKVEAVAAGLSVDPTGDQVQMAFMAGTTNPGSGDWLTASWEVTAVTGVYWARCLVGPTGGVIALPVGVYTIWVKMLDAPETIIRPFGNLKIQ